MSSKNKKRAIRTIAVILVITALALIAYAASREQKIAKNKFTPGGVTLAVYENEVLTENENTVTLKLSDDNDTYTAEKKVQIKNVSKNTLQQAYIRVCIFSEFMNENTEYNYQIFIPYQEFSDAVSGNTFTQKDVTFTLAEDWQDNWYYDGGYFYYKIPVSAKDNDDLSSITEPLLQSVAISRDKWNEYTSRGANLKVTVLADAIQSVGGAVENRWTEDNVELAKVIKSNDVTRPNEAAANSAVADIIEEFAVAEGTSTVTRAVSQRSIDNVMNSIVSLNVTVIYNTVDSMFTTEDMTDDTDKPIGDASNSIIAVEDETPDIPDIFDIESIGSVSGGSHSSVSVSESDNTDSSDSIDIDNDTISDNDGDNSETIGGSVDSGDGVSDSGESNTAESTGSADSGSGSAGGESADSSSVSSSDGGSGSDSAGGESAGGGSASSTGSGDGGSGSSSAGSAGSESAGGGSASSTGGGDGGSGSSGAGGESTGGGSASSTGGGDGGSGLGSGSGE